MRGGLSLSHGHMGVVKDASCSVHTEFIISIRSHTIISIVTQISSNNKKKKYYKFN